MTNYGEENGNNESIKFETKVIKSSLFDNSGPYIFVTGDTTVTGGDVNTNVAFKNFVPFTKCLTYINYEHIYIADNFDITIPMYNLIEYNHSRFILIFQIHLDTIIQIYI